ncbi:hypothetical protein J5Y04_31535 [Kitasatospora sp. RG8]|uniref:hypothetical protein n=1 Tax=Kitasatospora sp. RG8 TaxID=2820815 RepID=UPI001ADF15C5|nr:hypothetical protein [Kitasatospora sp. RG8]MBP0454040.1 hypothetical protein [Kitasatospora sp. RG8]
MRFLAHIPLPIILISQDHLRAQTPAEATFWLVAALATATASGFHVKRPSRS